MVLNCFTFGRVSHSVEKTVDRVEDFSVEDCEIYVVTDKYIVRKTDRLRGGGG